MTDNQVEQSLRERLLEIDPSRTDLLFTVLFALVMAVFLVETLSYDGEAQLFPLLVLVPTFLMLGFLMAIQLSSRVQTFVDERTGDSLMGEALDEPEDDQTEKTTDLETFRINSLKMVSWMMLLLLFVYFGGHLAGITLFLFFIYYFYSQQTVVRAVIYTLVNIGLIYLLFIVLMGARLHTGVLFELLGF